MTYLTYTKNFDDNLLMLLCRDHSRYTPIVQFFDNVTQGLSELSWIEAEMIAAEVSKANRSEFCSGIRDGMIDALYVEQDVSKNEKLNTVLTFALKLNQDATTITQSDVDTLVDAGWTEQTVEDITGLVAIQKFYNTLATGLGFKGLPQSAFNEIGKDTVRQGGYTASFRSFVAMIDNEKD